MMAARETLSLLILSLLTAACSGPERPYSIADGSTTGILAGEPVSASDEITRSTVGIEAPGYGVYCTGVLIAPNLIVTAAHCTGIKTRPTLLNIVFGFDLTKNPERRQVLGGRVSDLWPRLGQDQDSDWGDIAVLRFEGTAPESFRPAEILPSQDLLKDGQEVTLAGFGITRVDTQEMTDILMKVSVRITRARFSETEILFSQQNGKGACHGDSGGPAFTQLDGKLFLIGVTSRSATIQGALNCADGSISTSVPAHMEFLKTASIELNSAEFVPNEPMPQPKLNPRTSP